MPTESRVRPLDLPEIDVGRQDQASWRRVWRVVWPKLVALAIVAGAWELVFVSHFRPAYILPGPATVARRLWSLVSETAFWPSVGRTMEQAAIDFAAAAAVGAVVGIVVARVPVLRSAVGSLITGMQTVPSVIWVPPAILLFKLSATTILFVVVLGAAPAVANGFVNGIDHVPRALLRAGRAMGAHGISLQRHVVVPAALPSAIQGLKQGWAFAWHALMTAEFLVLVNGQISLGSRLEYAQQTVDPPSLYALVIVIVAIGVLADVAFSTVDRAVRVRRGLVETGSA